MSSKTLSIEISGTNYKLSDQEQDYIDRKCRKLVNHMPMHSRRSAFVSAKISLLTQPGDDKYQCDVVLTLPDKTLVASEQPLISSSVSCRGKSASIRPSVAKTASIAVASWR